MIVCLSHLLQKKSASRSFRTYGDHEWFDSHNGLFAKVACFTSSRDCSLPSGSGIFESGNFLLKLDSLQSGKFAPRENNPLYGSVISNFEINVTNLLVEKYSKNHQTCYAVVDKTTDWFIGASWHLIIQCLLYIILACFEQQCRCVWNVPMYICDEIWKKTPCFHTNSKLWFLPEMNCYTIIFHCVSFVTAYVSWGP